MPEEQQQQPPQVPAPLGAPAVTYPEDYEDLKAFFAETAPVIEKLRPHYDDIKPLLEDDEYFNLWKGTKEVYDIRKDANKPKYSPEMQMLRDEMLDTFKPLAENFQTEKQQREEEKKTALEQQQEANKQFGQRLAAERPELLEDNAAGLYMLASYAARDNVSLEEAWKRKGAGFIAPPKKATPPVSLRGDAASPGVPGPSREAKITSSAGLRKRLADNLRASGMKG